MSYAVMLFEFMRVNYLCLTALRTLPNDVIFICLKKKNFGYKYYIIKKILKKQNKDTRMRNRLIYFIKDFSISHSMFDFSNLPIKKNT